MDFFSSEVFAGAVAVQALKKYEEKGSEDHTDGKQIVTSIATEEMLKIFSERSIDGGDDEDTEEKKAKKQNSIQKMVESAATNLFEATYLKL